MKKSIFSKIFINNIIIILVSVLVLGVFQYFLISQYIFSERVNALEKNADAIIKFVQNGKSSESVLHFLNGFSHSTNTNIIITNNDGEILLASSPNNYMNKDVTHIEENYLSNVFSGKENIIKGTLGDLYKTPMFTLQMPILRGSRLVGAILISNTVPEMSRMQNSLFKIILFSFLAVLLVSLILSYAISRRLSKPIKAIGTTAKRFASGDFSSRVNPGKKGHRIIEIDELTRSFNDMAETLEQSDKIRNNFISDVSHEIRTPMTTIGGFVDGILDDTIPHERHRDYLLIIKEEISRLSSLLNSFLDITRLQSDKNTLKFSAFDINETIRRTLVGFENSISEKNISVGISMESEKCMVRADMNSIRQVLTNLIENAVKFTQAEGTINISVSSTPSEAKITVYNTGCGIPEDEQKFIFERFYKADKSRAFNHRGTGIGLYIAKDIISRHGKEISVRSQEGVFAEFSFTLDKEKI